MSTIIALATYGTDKTHKRAYSAMCWHGSRTLQSLSKHKSIEVWADIQPGSRSVQRIHSRLVVHRVWSKGSLGKLLNLIPRLWNHSAKTFYVQFEFNVLGGIVSNLTLLLIMAVARLSGKRVVFELHQVIKDVGELKKHVDLGLRMVECMYNLSLWMYYFLIGAIAHTVIVFEQELKERLSRFVKSSKVEVLALSVSRNRAIKQSIARKRLNLPRRSYVVLLFGYINGYKGFDWAIQALGSYTDDIYVVIAGGPNPYMQGTLAYDTYFKRVCELASLYPNIRMTGFIPEEQIPMYFGAADVALLPYEVFLSASGPFSQSLSHSTPLLMSRKLMAYTKSEDIRSSIDRSGLTDDDVFFDLDDGTQLRALLQQYTKNTSAQKKLSHMVKLIQEMRDESRITSKYLQLLSRTIPQRHIEAYRLANQLAID